MIRHLVVFWILLLNVRYARVQAQTAIWKFPEQSQNLEPNMIDTVLLDWTSTLPSTILRMWCQNETDGQTFNLASSFYVNSTGPFQYVMETYSPDETAFPLPCHAELAADPMGTGVDSLAAIIWSSNSAEAAKTISQTQASSSVTVTVVSTASPSPTPTSAANISPSQAQTTDSQSKSPSPIPSTKQPTILPTNSSASLPGTTIASQTSTSASASSSAPSSASSSRSTGPNNSGAIIGGAIGGVALLSFIILALLFLRKYQRSGASSSPVATVPSKRGFYLFNVYKKRGPKARTTGLFEKEGDTGAYETDPGGYENDTGAYEKKGTGLPHGGRIHEKEASVASRWGEAHELQGSAAWKKTMSRGGSWVRSSEGHAKRYSPVELPGGTNNFL